MHTLERMSRMHDLVIAAFEKNRCDFPMHFAAFFKANRLTERSEFRFGLLKNPECNG
jgi:hypothetical protein